MLTLSRSEASQVNLQGSPPPQAAETNIQEWGEGRGDAVSYECRRGARARAVGAAAGCGWAARGCRVWEEVGTCERGIATGASPPVSIPTFHTASRPHWKPLQ